ncbi:hypothetical protein CR513_00168, partial [Mucuna pruriens]
MRSLLATSVRRYLVGEFLCYYSHKCDYEWFDDEKFIFLSDDNKVTVEAIETFRFQLKIEFHLDLFKIFVVSYFRQNLIFISILDKFDFFSFGNNQVSLYQNSMDSSSLINNIYMFDVVTSYKKILQTNSRGTK